MNLSTAQGSVTSFAGILSAALPEFDLSRVIAKVSSKNPDWGQDRLDEAEAGYRKFLATAKSSPKTRNVPSDDVDEIWHTHILFTKQYHQDCQAYFGSYYHHEPTEDGMCDGNCGGEGSGEGGGGP